MYQTLHLSQTVISSAAASGAVARDLGYLPRRQTTPPQNLIQGWRRFLDPGAHVAAPKPSAYHPAPRHPRPAA